MYHGPLKISNLHRKSKYQQNKNITMAKKNFAHLSLNTYLEAVCKVNYRKSVTIRKIFKNSLKLDQAECCNIICLKMTTK